MRISPDVANDLKLETERNSPDCAGLRLTTACNNSRSFTKLNIVFLSYFSALLSALIALIDPLLQLAELLNVRTTRSQRSVPSHYRERGDASDFTTSLDEYRKYLRRKVEAQAMKAEFERQDSGEGSSQRDYSLKENIVIPLKIGTPVNAAAARLLDSTVKRGC